MALTPSERRFVARLSSEEGAWAAPAQLLMARRLQARGLLRITATTRWNQRRGCHERLCVAVQAVHGDGECKPQDEPMKLSAVPIIEGVVEARWRDHSGDWLSVCLAGDGTACIATGRGIRTWVELSPEQADELAAFLAKRRDPLPASSGSLVRVVLEKSSIEDLMRAAATWLAIDRWAPEAFDDEQMVQEATSFIAHEVSAGLHLRGDDVIPSGADLEQRARAFLFDNRPRRDKSREEPG